MTAPAAPLKRWYAKAGDLILATTKQLVQEANPTAGLPARRYAEQVVAGVDGTVPQSDAPWGERVWRLPVTILPFDDVGFVSHTEGWTGHMVANTQDLLAEVALLGSLVDLRVRQPVESGSGSDGGDEWVELQADAAVYGEVVVSVDRRLSWAAIIEFTLHRPIWHELPKVTLAAATSQSFNTQGSAPVLDPVLTFAGDGTWTDGTSVIEIDGSSGAVVVSKASTGEWQVTQGGQLAMHLLGPATNGRFPRWPQRTQITCSGTASVGIEFHRGWW